MKILVVSPKNKTVFHFRGDLIKDMIAVGNKVYVTGPNQDFMDDIMSLGVKEFIEIPFVKDGVKISGDIFYLQQLKKVIKKVKPDCVFGYTIKPVIYGSLAAKSCGVKRICPMITGLGRVYTSENLRTKVLRTVTTLLYRAAFKGCDKVIFQNPDDVRELVDAHALPENKCVIVNGSGVNMERFHRSRIPDKPVFLMVSRMIREKGVLDFAEAARIVKKSVPEARFIVLGGYDHGIGALKPEDIKDYIEDSTIEFPGEVKDPVPFYGQASVFVLPSYYREGLPRTILEGMSCGRPIITTDWTGCREPIEHGVNGYLVPIQNPEELAKRMLELTNREKVLKLSDAAYNTCKEKYAVEIVNRQMRAVIGY